MLNANIVNVTEQKTNLSIVGKYVLKSTRALLTISVAKETEKITDTNAKIGTGMTIKITLKGEKEEYTVVVTGDLDGNMGDIDLLRLARYNAGIDKNLKGAYLKGANIFKDNNYADDRDLLKMARVLVGLDNL